MRTLRLNVSTFELWVSTTRSWKSQVSKYARRLSEIWRGMWHCRSSTWESGSGLPCPGVCISFLLFDMCFLLFSSSWPCLHQVCIYEVVRETGRVRGSETLFVLGNTSYFVSSGWRRGQTGKSARCVKQASAGRRLSLFMGEGARSRRIPGETRPTGCWGAGGG